MTYIKSTNIIGALALTLSDALLDATQRNLPNNIKAASLALIGHSPGISIRDLSVGLELSHAGTVRLVDRMVADGLVSREKFDEDKRTVALFLSPAGHTQVALILSSRHRALEAALSGLSDGEIAALTDISEKLLRSIVVDEDHALKICRLCDNKNCNGCPVDVALEKQELG